MIIRFHILLSLLLLIATTVFSQISVFPADDVYILKGTNTTGNEIRGMETVLKSYRNPATNDTWQYTPYLKFCLHDINFVVDNVKLKLYATVAEPHSFDVYTTLLTGWAEDALTFNNFASQVGEISATPVASLDVLGSSTAQYYEWDVTAAVIAAIEKGERFVSFKLQNRYAVKTSAGTGLVLQFHSKENASGNKPQLYATTKNIDPFKLSELKIDNVLINGFLPDKTKYYVSLPFNATIIPSITALAYNPQCSLKISNAKSLLGTLEDRTASITAKIGLDSVVYKIIYELSADPNDARLDTIKINNIQIEKFSKDSMHYLAYLPYTTTLKPDITVVLTDKYANAEVTPPTSLFGTKQERTASIQVTSQSGQSNRTYFVEFEILPKLDIFIAIGQSNMAGRGTMTEADLTPIDSVFILTPTGNVEIASNPLNKYSSVRKELSMQQMSPSCSFVKTIRDKTGHFIGLMQNARGGTSIESWTKGSMDRLYEEAIRRTLEIKRFGEIKGIIWHQGEANRKYSTDYKNKLRKLVTDFRTDLGMPNLFFIAGELAYWYSDVSDFNDLIQSISTFIHNSDWASAEDLTPLIDTSDPHFDAASVKMLGERYAQKVLNNVYNLTEVKATKQDQYKMAEIKAVNGHILVDAITGNLDLRIFDVLGRPIIAQQVKRSEYYSFPLLEGIYYVQFQNHDTSDCIKLLIK